MDSSSEDSDSPLIDEKTGLPILFIGSNQTVPKQTYVDTVRIDPTRKRPKRYRRRKAIESQEVAREEESRRGGSGGNGVAATNFPIQLQEQNENALALDTATTVAIDVDDDDNDHPVNVAIEFEEYDEYHGEDMSASDDDSQQIVVSNELKDVYMVKVLQARAFMMIDEIFTTFLIQDIDPVQKKLRIHGFQIIERSILMLKNEKRWILSCSCNEGKQRYVKALGRNLDVDFDELKRIINSKFSECLHIAVCYELIAMFDSVNNIDPFQEASDRDHSYGMDLPEETLIQELGSLEHSLILVKPPYGSFAVVGIDRKGFVCRRCMAGRHSCPHINCLTNYLKVKEGNLPEFLLDFVAARDLLQQSVPTNRVPTSISRGRISWCTTQRQRKIYALSSHALEYCVADGTMALSPADDACPECGGDMSIIVEYPSSKKRLLLSADVVQVTVFVRRCAGVNCAYERTYCGSADGILHMGSFLLGHDVLRDYLNLFLTGSSCSLIGFYDKWKLNYEAAGCPLENMINYQQLRCSWYSYLNLLDIDYREGFKCNICGQFPDLITCDATTLGFKRIFSPSKLHFPEHRRGTALKGSFAERTLLTAVELRKLLKSYSKRKVVDSERMKLLLQQHCMPLAEFVNWCESTFETVDKIAPSVMTFLKCMSSISPVCSYFPSSSIFLNLIEEVKDGLDIRNHPQKLQTLQTLAPVIFSVILQLPTALLPLQLLDLFDALEGKVKATFRQNPHILQAVSADEIPSSFSFLPNWPLLNVRGLYKQDLVCTKDKNEDQCTKEYRGHPTLMPGIFTLYCKHDICYGFDVMQSQESPNVPFTLFRTRFPEAPATIVYDACCKLHSYCLNRDPGFYKKTSFLVDRFHWKNHKACAESYRLSIYPQHVGLNSQINEQRNKQLKRAKGQLSYMNPTNFVNSCRLTLWYCNLKVKQKMTNASLN